MVRKRVNTKTIIERLKLLEQGFKYCDNCRETKSIDDFAKDPRHTDGLQTYCRECCNLLRRTKWGEKVRAGVRAWQKANPIPKTTRIITEKQCSRCLETKPVSEFSPDKRKPDGYQSQCKKCQNFVRLVLNREKTLNIKKQRHQKK